jgi:hypothetical protein
MVGDADTDTALKRIAQSAVTHPTQLSETVLRV